MFVGKKIEVQLFGGTIFPRVFPFRRSSHANNKEII